MVDEILSDMEFESPPKLTFDELKNQVLREPKLATKRLDLLKTLYFYSKDSKFDISLRYNFKFKFIANTLLF